MCVTRRATRVSDQQLTGEIPMIGYHLASKITTIEQNMAGNCEYRGEVGRENIRFQDHRHRPLGHPSPPSQSYRTCFGAAGCGGTSSGHSSGFAVPSRNVVSGHVSDGLRKIAIAHFGTVRFIRMREELWARRRTATPLATPAANWPEMFHNSAEPISVDELPTMR